MKRKIALMFLLSTVFSISVVAGVREDLHKLPTQSQGQWPAWNMYNLCEQTYSRARDATAYSTMIAVLGVATGGIVTLLDIPYMMEAHQRNKASSECKRSFRNIEEGMAFLNGVYDLNMGHVNQSAKSSLSGIMSKYIQVNMQNIRRVVELIIQHEKMGMNDLVNHNPPERRVASVRHSGAFGTKLQVISVVAPDYRQLIMDYIVQNIIPTMRQEQDAVLAHIAEEAAFAPVASAPVLGK